MFCAGNHDIDRQAADLFERPDTPARANHLLRVETLELISRPFSTFEANCRALGLPRLGIGGMESHLVGVRRHRGIRFAALNSAWFCRGNDDRGRLFVGLPQLEVMAASGQLLATDRYDEDDLTIAVVHHPEAWLSDSELAAYGDRPSPYYYLAERTHILLSGHTHGGVSEPKRIGSAALLFVGGATYDGARYRNNVSLLQLDTGARSVCRKVYEFDPRNGYWRVHSERHYSMRRQDRQRLTDEPGNDITVGSTAAVRDRARAHAERYIETKSRAVARTTSLPRLLRRRVGVHDPAERIQRERGELFLHTERHSLPLREAIASGRPTFLLGDLGSGKSTLVGQLVSDLNAGPEGLLALLVPAKYFLTRVSPFAAVIAAVAFARSRAGSMPPVTKWYVVPPCLTSGSPARWVTTNTGMWNGGFSPHGFIPTSNIRLPITTAPDVPKVSLRASAMRPALPSAGNIHSWSRSPPSPMPFPTDTFGPVLKPSILQNETRARSSPLRES